MRMANYFTVYTAKERAKESLRILHDAMPSGCELHNVFRYRHSFLDEDRYSDLNAFFLYDNFDELSDEEVAELEKSISRPFSLIRQMHTMSFFRYPNRLRSMPDDRFLAQLVKAWRRFFIDNKIDFFMGSLMDDYPGFIGMEVAKSLNIPVIVPYGGGGRLSRSYLLTDVDFMPVFYKKVEGAEAEKKAKEAVEAMAKETVTNPSVGKLADSYFNLLMPSTTLNLLKATASSFHRYYFIVPPQERKIWLSPPELMNRQLWYFLHSKFSKFIFNKKPKEGERFVFFPLHFSQDAALKAVNPLADQVRLVEDISKVLPHGTYLYVKPHPHWKCSDLNIKDMLRLNKLPNVRLLDYHASTRDMIRDCVYVIIINSSVGHEALVQKKKVLSFGCGYPADVIPRIADPEELKGADNIEMDWDKCRDYIANVYHHAIFHTDQKKYNVGAWNREFAEALLKEMLSAYEYMKPKR